MDRFVNKKIEKQTIYEIYRACRLCGAGGGYKMPIIQNVVNLDSCDVELRQKIRECVQIEVHQDDKMPPLICELCVDKVNDFYEFLEMCRQTNKRTRLKLGLPPQMLPRGAPDAGDCILGVTEPIFVNDEDSNEPLSDKKVKVKGGKLKKEPEKKWKDVKVKLEDKVSPRESRSSRHRPPSPPRLRRDKRPDSDNMALSRLQLKLEKSVSPPPKSILKKGVFKKPEISPQSQTTRLKRSRDGDVKPETPAKKVKISLRPMPLKSLKVSQRNLSSRQKKEEVERNKTKQKEAKRKETEAEKHAKDSQALCLVCGVGFKTTQAMMSHKRCHGVTFTNPDLACNACELWFSNTEEAEAHYRRHRRNGLRYRCWRCTRSCTSLQAYEDHIEKGKCVPWEEVPDVKCDTCWKTFPTRNLLNGHRCPGVAARPGKCEKCGKLYATKRSLANHTRVCKKGNVIISPELRGRLKPIQVRVAKCDALLNNVKQEHYDVSSVVANFGLDKNCVYPYISSGLRIKSEPSDCMVKINDLDFGSYVHWDSDDASGDSDTDNLDNLDLSVFTKKRKVESLAACALKTIFSRKFLGKVPRRFRRVKIETIVASALNNSLSDLNLNDSDTVSLVKNVTIGNDNKVNNCEKKVAETEDDDLFSKVNSDAKITNSDFDSLFGNNNEKTYSDDNSGKSGTEFDDKLVSMSNNNSEESNNIKEFNDLDSGAKQNIKKENNDSLTVIHSNDNIIDITERTNGKIANSIVEENSTDLKNVQLQENQLYVKENDGYVVSLKTDVNSDLEKKIFDDDEIKLSKTKIVNLNENVDRMILNKNNEQEKTNKLEKNIKNFDTEINDGTVIKYLPENNEILYTKNDKEHPSNIDKLKRHTEDMQTYITVKSESLNTISEADIQGHNKDAKGKSKKSDENDIKDNITENNVNKDSDANVEKMQVNGDANIDDIALNMNDLEDLSGTEFDDCELMAEIDAQIGEKKRESVEKKIEIDRQDIKNEKAKENEKDMGTKNIEIHEKVTEIADEVVKNVETTAKSMKEKEDNEADIESKQDKINLEDLFPKENKSMDLDNISDEEFEFTD